MIVVKLWRRTGVCRGPRCNSSSLTARIKMEVSVPAPMPLDFSISMKSRQQDSAPPSSSPAPVSQSPPAAGLVLPATSSAGLLKLLKESGARAGPGESALSSSAFRVVTPKGMFNIVYLQSATINSSLCKFYPSCTEKRTLVHFTEHTTWIVG